MNLILIKWFTVFYFMKNVTYTYYKKFIKVSACQNLYIQVEV